MVLAIPPSDQDRERIGCLLLSACLEQMMREELTVMACHLTSWHEVEFVLGPLLDAYRGRGRQLQLFKRIGAGSFNQDCVAAGFPEFSGQWERIASQRNHCAHSAESSYESIADLDLAAFVDDAIAVFASIHNKYNVETASYRGTVSPLTRAEVEEFKSLLDEECES
jgi:hypothetical protein